jgi:hypothetical protein
MRRFPQVQDYTGRLLRHVIMDCRVKPGNDR